MRKPYPTDLSDAEWSCLKPHLPAPEAHGRPRLHGTREILDAILYVLKSGCAWRLLPHDFPPWPTVYHYFRAWRLSGLWERMHSALRERVRVHLQRNPQPSAGIVDSQSVKTTGVGGEECGYDGAKKIEGRKRHLLVDTQGLVLMAKVHRANVTDRDGIKLLLEPARIGFPSLNPRGGDPEPAAVGVPDLDLSPPRGLFHLRAELARRDYDNQGTPTHDHASTPRERDRARVRRTAQRTPPTRR